ncbi:hypothetical protein HPS57_13745 [Prevotella sp. PINT]|jgi:hypothetical protein|uniref:hypothetical protein n=1 Tax=Bacteroidales TaxID=171549 RepID=UPI0015531F03|nr:MULTISPECIES: hypothetical protein [Bacteroidales]NPD83028.1 hypothetical protein [Palleniella intestinalis]
MIDNRIYTIAAKNGWNVSVKLKGINLCFDFQRTTLSGVPFSFTAEITDDKTESLVAEIVSFVDAIEPYICAKEWMIKSGVMASNRYFQATADIEDIRTKAWLLACELSEAISGIPIWVANPKQWN